MIVKRLSIFALDDKFYDLITEQKNRWFYKKISIIIVQLKNTCKYKNSNFVTLITERYLNGVRTVESFFMHTFYFIFSKPIIKFTEKITHSKRNLVQ